MNNIKSSTQMKKSSVNYMVLLFITLLLGSCVKDNGVLCPTRGTRIALALGEMEVVETRSAASDNERIISDACLLIFGADGFYKSGEKVDVATQVDATDLQHPIITTNLDLKIGDKIVVLCNTGVSGLPVFTVGVSTTDDINNKFMSLGWSINQAGAASGKGMPMSGEIVWSAASNTVTMYRSVAKVQVLFDANLLANSSQDAVIQSSFTLDNTSFPAWGLYNSPGEWFSNNLYSIGGAFNPAATDWRDYASLSQRVAGQSGATAQQQTFYLPEQRNSTTARDQTVAATEFHIFRTCVLLNTLAGYYRLDFAKQNAVTGEYEYLDIQRNHHYKITINKVRSAGYATVEEAMAHPASNVEYTVVVTGDNDNVVDSNGQYALVLTGDEVTVRGENGVTLDALSIRAQLPENPDFDFLFTTMKISVASVTPLTSQGGSAVLNTTTFNDADTPVKLTFGNFSDRTDVKLRITLGNIVKYVTVHYIPTGYWFRQNSSSDSDWLYWGSTAAGTALPTVAAGLTSLDIKADEGYVLSANRLTLIKNCVNSNVVNRVAVDLSRSEYESSVFPVVFKAATTLQSIALPSNITETANSAFNGCTSLTTVTEMNKLSVIGEYSFNNCTNLSSISFSPDIQRIERFTFYKCTSLTGSLLIPEGVTYIGQQAFMSCENIEVIDLPSTLTEIFQGTFADTYDVHTLICRAINAPKTTYVTSGSSVFAGGNAVVGRAIGKNVLPTSNRKLYVPVSATNYSPSIFSLTDPYRDWYRIQHSYGFTLVYGLP